MKPNTIRLACLSGIALLTLLVGTADDATLKALGIALTFALCGLLAVACVAAGFLSQADRDEANGFEERYHGLHHPENLGDDN